MYQAVLQKNYGKSHFDSHVLARHRRTNFNHQAALPEQQQDESLQLDRTSLQKNDD